MSWNLVSKRLRVTCDDNEHNEDERNQKIYDSLSQVWSEVENLVNKSLPEGFYCKIED